MPKMPNFAKKTGKFHHVPVFFPILPKCTGFTPPSTNQIIEDSFRGPPNNCHIVLGGPPEGTGPRAPKLLKMALSENIASSTNLEF